MPRSMSAVLKPPNPEELGPFLAGFCARRYLEEPDEPLLDLPGLVPFVQPAVLVKGDKAVRVHVGQARHRAVRTKKKSAVHDEFRAREERELLERARARGQYTEAIHVVAGVLHPVDNVFGRKFHDYRNLELLMDGDGYVVGNDRKTGAITDGREVQLDFGRMARCAHRTERSPRRRPPPGPAPAPRGQGRGSWSCQWRPPAPGPARRWS